ncbi:MAG TPA: BON domain-containing protein [Thermoanaerobaculia bacterium]|nr:BON domain-containing protein [Thermoanaerobaculia bacterium]
MTTKIQDIELRKDVLEELEWDPSIDARTIGVAIEKGVIALTGHVGSYADKANAEKIVKRVHGVKGVANDLEVKLASSFERDDVDIARSAVNALEWNVSVPKNRVKVTVTKGWVTLDGSVDWYYQKRAAEEAVFLLAGVRGVANNINVTAKHVEVQDVKAKIEAALKRNAEVDSKKIAVQASDGKVTLTGTVRSWVEREDAVNAAWSAPGVRNVVDQIRIHA